MSIIEKAKETLFDDQENERSKRVLFHLFHAFDQLMNQNNTNMNSETVKINKKLTELMGKELISIF
jgi:cellobiose-specific phosphotransferase system component IIA